MTTPTDEGIPTPPTDENPFLPTCIGSEPLQCDGTCYFQMNGDRGGNQCGFVGYCLAKQIGGDYGKEYCEKSFPHRKWLEKCIEFGNLGAKEKIEAAICALGSPPTGYFPVGSTGCLPVPGCCCVSENTRGATGHLLCDCLKELNLLIPGGSLFFPLDFVFCLTQGALCCKVPCSCNDF